MHILLTIRNTVFVIYVVLVSLYVVQHVQVKKYENGHYPLWQLHSMDGDVDESAVVDTSWKHICTATTWGGKKSYWTKVFYRLTERKCPENRCAVHLEPHDFDHCDAILFNALNLPKSEEDVRKLFKPSFSRHPNQSWVFVSAEPPLVANIGETLALPLFDEFFNWTMTYRKDSTVQFPFGLISRDVKGKESADIRSLIPSKPDKEHKIAWAVSRCEAPSKREVFVEELKKYISVSIYGKCGEKCGQRNTLGFLKAGEYSAEDMCTEALQKHYFYLALENSICREYVTEKFYRSLTLGLIPIVFRRSDYDFAPKNSFISIDDYDSVEELADHLHEVIENEEYYLSYHEWRRLYSVELGLPFEPMACDLCSQLHSDLPRVVERNISGWFGESSKCTFWSNEKVP